MEYADKKTSFMGKSYTYEPAGSGGSYVVIDRDEYDKLEHDRKMYEYWYESEKSARERDVAKAKEDAEAYKRQADAEALEKINSIKRTAKASIAIVQTELDKKNDLNNHLFQIVKERSNASRGMQPKKERSGYRFVGKIMQTKTISGHDKKTGAIYTDVWTTVLETPYDVALAFDHIEKRIFADLRGDSGVLSKMNVDYWVIKGNDDKIWKGPYSEAIEENPEKKSYLFDYKFMANVTSGFWEIQITTTGPISIDRDMT